MAVKMVLLWVSIALSVIGINASGELNILHSPDSLKFSGNDKLSETHLKEVFSAALGLSVEENTKWDGLAVVDPFNVPEALVEVYIDGVSSLGNFANIKNVHKYGLVVDEYQPDTFEELSHRINQRFSNGGNNLVDIKLSDPNELTGYAHIFGEITPPKLVKHTYKHLKKDVEEDHQFLTELENLKTLTAGLRKSGLRGDNVLDIYYLRFHSLHALSDFHGPNSLQTKEAKALLTEALLDLSKAFQNAYYGSVLFTVVTTEVAHSRRSIRAAPVEQQRVNTVDTQDLLTGAGESQSKKDRKLQRRQFDMSDDEIPDDFQKKHSPDYDAVKSKKTSPAETETNFAIPVSRAFQESNALEPKQSSQRQGDTISTSPMPLDRNYMGVVPYFETKKNYYKQNVRMKTQGTTTRFISRPDLRTTKTETKTVVVQERQQKPQSERQSEVPSDEQKEEPKEAPAEEPPAEKPPAETPADTPAPATQKPASKPEVKADGYSGDYAAIFNIILWFSVVFVFALVAITYTLIDMDPGRDSIIYRMTSTRIKKDN